MRIPISDLGAAGMIADPAPTKLPLQAFSELRNARVHNDAIESCLGEELAFTAFIESARFMLPVPLEGSIAWLYTGLTNAYARIGTSQTVVTRTPSYTSPESGWSGCLLNGLAILNNPFDIPQVWLNPGASVPLVNLPNWPATWRAGVLRSFRNYLVALDVTKNGVRDPHLVLWSHPADPRSVPVSWDISDPTRDAGEFPLAETEGFIVDSKPLKGANLIYKEDGVFLMQFIGGNFVFSLQKTLSEVNILAKNCIVTIGKRGDRHVVLGQEGLYVHDGATSENVLTSRMRKYFTNKLNPARYERSFLLHNRAFTEVWACFPADNSDWCNQALIWNYTTNSFSVRDLPNLTCGAVGQLSTPAIGSGGDTWAEDANSWDSDSTTWDERTFNPITQRILGADASQNIFQLDRGNKQFGVDGVQVTVVREGLTLTGKSYPDGKPIYDTDTVKLLKEVWLRVEGTTGQQLLIEVGAQEAPDKPVRWKGPYPYTIGVTKKLNPLISGKVLSIRIRSQGEFQWKLLGYDLEIEPVGA